MNAEAPLSGALAAVGAQAPLELGTIALGLLAGLALFLFGLDLMTSALKTVAGIIFRALTEIRSRWA